MRTLSITDDGAFAASEWLGDSLCEQDWRMAMPASALAELDEALADGVAPAASPSDTQRFAATLGFLAEVRERVFGASGVVVAGRLPVHEWGETRSVAAVTLLSRLMGPAMAQGFDGTTLYPVHDTGAKPAPGVRRSLTNVQQPFHTDAPWLARPADMVGLYCIEAARVGGESQCMSLRRICREVAAREPDLYRRLRENFLWHRQAEHAVGDSPVSSHPVIWENHGEWNARLYIDYVRSGHRAAGEPLDACGARALELLEHLATDRRRWLSFTLAPGEVEWLNNRWCTHARSAFEPLAMASRRRLMVRVWHRRDGSTALEA